MIVIGTLRLAGVEVYYELEAQDGYRIFLSNLGVTILYVIQHFRIWVLKDINFGCRDNVNKDYEFARDNGIRARKSTILWLAMCTTSFTSTTTQ